LKGVQIILRSMFTKPYDINKAPEFVLIGKTLELVKTSVIL